MIRDLAALFAAAALAGAAMPAEAQPVRAIDDAPSAAPKRHSEAGPVTVTGDPNRVICRKGTVTGSRLKKSKSCRTAREWAESEAANVDATKRLQRPGGLKDRAG